MTSRIRPGPVWLTIVLLVLAGCIPRTDYRYGAEQEAVLLERVLADSPEPGTDILSLSPAIIELLDHQISRQWSARKRLRALRELFYGEENLNLHYEAKNTLTASETFDAGAGNCLSLTTLFIAAARHIGIDAKYQAVRVDPVWDHEGNTMIRYEHIVATGLLPGGALYVVDFLPDFVIGDMRAHIISDREALALYYNNLGAEGVVDGRIDDAIRNLKMAIRLQPDFPDAWNNMGAALRRAGQYELAEFSYLRALDQDYNHFSALSNLAHFYEYQGREREARKFARKVNRYRARNPYFHYFLARLSFQQGRYDEAERQLRKSIRLKRDEPDFYVALAEVQKSRGEHRESLQTLALGDKYRQGILRAPERTMNHRYWNMVIDVNP